MPKKAGDKNNSIKEKLEYIGLDLENIPEELKDFLNKFDGTNYNLSDDVDLKTILNNDFDDDPFK